MATEPTLDGRVFGANVQRRRNLAGMNQHQLANKAGIGIATVKAIEAKSRPNIRATTARKLADALDVSIPELYGVEK